MKALKGMFGTAIGFAMAAAFSAGIIALVLSLAAEQLPGLKALGTQLRCIAGIPAEGSACVAEKFAALEAAHRAVEAERDDLVRQATEYEARRKELEALNGLVENYSQFQTETLRFGKVSTGIRFASVLKPEVWSEAWCYLDRDVRGLRRQITLGNQTSGEAVRWTRVSPAQLSDADLTRAQLDQAKAACHFPEAL
ncbi:hypothetical protein LA6_003679 [Marinibacterium anthonyi]|nr:hypothetical protein LA6_003679 [Marinibacterium anthonyi]